MEKLDVHFWEHRYTSNNTGWDLGEISKPIKTYVDQLTDKDISILIPGAGNAHEAIYLHQQGFKHVFVNDITVSALENLKTGCLLFLRNICYTTIFSTFIKPSTLLLSKLFSVPLIQN